MGGLGEGGRGEVRGVSGEGEGDVGGESCSSTSSGPPLSNSTSQRSFTAFLVRFAGGGRLTERERLMAQVAKAAQAMVVAPGSMGEGR